MGRNGNILEIFASESQHIFLTFWHLVFKPENRTVNGKLVKGYLICMYMCLKVKESSRLKFSIPCGFIIM